MKAKYVSVKQLHFERVRYKHISLIKKFQTFQNELKKFLDEDAIKNQDMCVGLTYMIFDRSDFVKHRKTPVKRNLLGYVTIFNDSISLNTRLKDSFKAKGVNYKYLPALKIGRLCIDDKFRGLGIGKLVIAYCVHRACYLNESSACRFMTVDAKRDSDRKRDSLHFYRRVGFDVLEHKDKTRDQMIQQTSGETPMCLDIYHLVKKIVKLPL